MAVTKFYHYTITVESDRGRKVDPMSVANDDIFSSELYSISSTQTKKYDASFRKIENGIHQGRVIRTQDESSFLRRDDDDTVVPLTDRVSGNGDTGEINRGHTDFVVKADAKQLDLIVEVGAQTPGIQIIKKYIRDHLNLPEDYILDHESKLEGLTDEKLERLLSSDFMEAEVSFKKHPDRYDGEDTGRALDSMTPDDYRIKFNISLEQGKDKRFQTVRSYFRNNLPFFEGDESLKTSLRKIDFGKMMHTFRVESVDEDGDIEMNFADLARVDEIDTSSYSPFGERLGDRLYEALES